MVKKVRPKKPAEPLKMSYHWRLGLASLAVMIISLIGITVIIYHLFTDHFSGESLTGADLLVLVAVVVTTIAAGFTAIPPVVALISEIRSGRTETSDAHPSAESVEHLPDRAPDHIIPKVPQILRLKRSAERLSNIERELIRRISLFDTDVPTDKLIAEIQICTNRMLKQIDDAVTFSPTVNEENEPDPTREPINT